MTQKEYTALLEVFSIAQCRMREHTSLYYGMCRAVSYGVMKTEPSSEFTYDYLYDKSMNILRKYAGENYQPAGTHWFPCTEEGKEKRISLLTQIVLDLGLESLTCM